MDDRILIFICFGFTGLIILLIIVALATYHVGYNNGYSIGYKDSRRDFRRNRIDTNRSQSFNSIRILPPKSQKPVYIDGRSKYKLDEYDD